MSLISRRLGLLATASFAVAIAAPAAAQTQSNPGVDDTATQAPPRDVTATPDVVSGPTGPAQQQAQAASDAPSGDIVVTGSRIARPTLSSPVPITTVSAADLTRTGNTVIGDVLNNLPQLASTVGQQSSGGNNIGITGLNLLDLRGLGTARTLVLVNGRRHITALEGEFQVDVNTIPTDLIDRVDIVTGGTSAVYGSDAMAGVVNFVLKRNFEGVSLNAQGGITDKGDRGTYRLAGTFGKNFNDGRGNVSLALEYDQADPVFYTGRDSLTGAYSGRNQFQLVDNPALNNTIPDRTFLTGVRSFGSSDGGSFIAYNGSNTRSCAGAPAAACLPNGFPRVFLFQDDGSLRESNYGRDFRPVGSGNNQNGDGSTLNNSGYLIPRSQRYIANFLAHYDVSDAFKPFIEAKYVRTDSFQTSSPSFAQGGPQGVGQEYDPFGNYTLLPISLDNPFLNPAARATISSLLAPGSTFFNLNRNNIDLGVRGERDLRETYRAVVGAEGTFNDDWHYDFSVNYGQLNSNLTFTNNRIERNFFNAVDAVRNAAGQIVCRVNQNSVTDPGCVPIDILGQNRASAAALAYINTNSTRTGKATEFDVNANLVGDSSQLFELPGGPLRFAIGAEYRRETARYAYDALVTAGETFLNAIPPFNPPAFAVKEAYGEIELPILKGQIVDELTLNGAARVADYKGSAGTVWAYNFGGLFAPIPDIKFRANYSRSVRAPTLGDLYSSASQNYASLDDPCDVNFINKGRANREANCRAAGVPVGFENAVARGSTLEILSGGNPGLTVEKSRSWTYGVVLQPRFIPGLALTVDYYDIKIKDVISPVGAQTILDGCYDGADLNNSFCQLVFPRAADGNFQSPALLQTTLNFSAERARGLDVDLSYNHRFDPDNKLSLRVVGNWVRTRDDYPYIDNPSQPERIKGELGTPEYQVNVSADYTYKVVTLGYQLRWIGRQSITDWEAQHDTYGVPALDPYYADRVYYPKVLYHDVRVGIEANDRFSIYGGVDNLTDKRPPYGLLGTGADAIYDNVGRFMYVGIRAKY